MSAATVKLSKKEHALAAARRGIRVFPIKSGSKKPPLLSDYPKLATTDPAQIEKWWGQWPNANIGGAVGARGDGRFMFCVDADNKPGQCGAMTVFAHELAGRELSRTYEQDTPNGQHWVYITDAPVKLGGANALGKNLDAPASYFIVAGSETAKGAYTIRTDAPFEAADPWVIEHLGHKRERQASTTSGPANVDAKAARDRAIHYLEHAQPAIEGEGGDDHTVQVAMRVGDLGVTEVECYALMLGERFNDRCVPPWDAEDLRQKVKSAYKSRTTPIGSAAPEAVFPVVVEPEQKTARFIDYNLAEFGRRKRKPYIIKGVLPDAEAAVLFGAPGSGKTFAAWDMAASIARGTDWRGHKVKQGRVYYVCAEGADGFAGRAEAYCRHHKITLEDLDIIVLPGAPNLMASKDVSDLIACINARAPVALVVVDTLAKATPGANENSGEDMGKVLGNCKTIREKTGAMILLIHHSGKDEARGARGWSGLLGAIDAEFQVSRFNEDRVLTVTKARDGKDGGEYGFRLNLVTLGQDEDDEPITSCVVEYTTALSKAQRRAGAKGVTGTHQRLLMNSMRDWADRDDVTADELVSEATRRTHFGAGKGKRDRRRERHVAALNALVAQELLKREGEHVRLV